MSNTYQPKIMQKCIDHARETMTQGKGGPFGAAVVKDGEVIVIASNSVLADSDPTAHAEMNAIRQACQALGTYDLSGCELYATGFPCPMCLSAIMWANIKIIHVAGLPEDAAAIGFRDDFMYSFIAELQDGEEDPSILTIDTDDICRMEAIKMYDEYRGDKNVIY